MARTELRERDISYLAAFPVTVPIRGIHGPFVPPVVVDPGRGFRNPDIGVDYGCWWIVTNEEDIPLPTAVVEEMQSASSTGHAWAIDLTTAVTDDEKQSLWVREWDRIREDLNAAAQRVTHGVPL